MAVMTITEPRTAPIREGLPHPRGATWDGKGTNFALFSAHAAKVEVCIFDENGEQELERIELPEYTNQIWHGYLPDVRPGRCTAIAFMDLMNPEPVTASILISYCSILTRSSTEPS